MKQTPEPMVSGRYFLPKAPETWWKWMLAEEVMSVNWMGPEGRGGVALAGDCAAEVAGCGVVGSGDGAGVAVCDDVEVSVGLGWSDGLLLQAMRDRAKKIREMVRGRERRDSRRSRWPLLDFVEGLAGSAGIKRPQRPPHSKRWLLRFLLVMRGPVAEFGLVRFF